MRDRGDTMSIKGNPTIVAENEDYYIIERGIKSRYYGLLKKGEPISSVKSWKGKGLYLSALVKGDFQRLKEPKEFKQK